MANFFGFPGGKNYERQFTRKSKEHSKTLVNLVDKLIFESLEEEVVLTIRKMTKNKVTIEIIEENIEYFKCGEYNKIHKDLQTIGISISYDMGWQ